MKRFLPVFLLPVFAALAGQAYAIGAIAQEAGWSGHLRVGAGGFPSKTNMTAGNDKYGIETGDASIDSLGDSPDSQSTTLPQINLNLKYTFESQTQLFLGNSLEEIVQLDLVTLFGVRQQFSDRSDERVIRIMARGISEDKADPMVKERCEWMEVR